MRESLKDPLRLEHIRDAARHLINKHRESGIQNIPEDTLEYFGVVKLLEIIGEAAYMLTPEFKESHPDTPWRQIAGMRHYLVHGYYHVNRQDIIQVVNDDLEPLYNQILEYLNESFE